MSAVSQMAACSTKMPRKNPGEAAAIRQAEIHQHDARGAEQRAGGADAARDLHGKAVAFQRAAQRVGQVPVVLDQQDGDARGCRALGFGGKLRRGLRDRHGPQGGRHCA